MSTAVKISDELVAKAKVKSKVFKRSVAGQIEYWAKIGQIILLTERGTATAWTPSEYPSMSKATPSFRTFRVRELA
ncbi:MAG: hypothetical protein A2277_04415 [Desulfobacterales bacterium RIFOXYA12_FULL_46_15]|nr:MAG: hypothetical protein A2277_04415 [Desulfobacterales bacterium RIFOXYA12_FULL_46_15]